MNNERISLEFDVDHTTISVWRTRKVVPGSAKNVSPLHLGRLFMARAYSLTF